MKISDNYITLTINKTNGGISSIKNDITGSDFITDSQDKCLIWRLTFKDQQKNIITINNNDADSPHIENNHNVINICWNDIKLSDGTHMVDVAVSICSDRENNETRLKIKIANHSVEYGLWDVEFPVISNIADKGKSDIAIPRGNWGQLYNNATEKITGEYPSYTLPMQFMTINNDDFGLYLAANDIRSYHKYFTCIPGEEFSVKTMPDDMGVPNRQWEHPYDFVMKCYKGDWFAGCKIYRQWVTGNTIWASKGFIEDRLDTPEFMRNISGWIIGRNGIDDAPVAGIGYHKAIGTPVGVHWYEWHQIKFDTNYPAYFPSKPDMSIGVEKMKKEGITVMPYINCRLWDTQEKDYESAIPYTAKDEDGNPIEEDYGSGTTLAVMCPTQMFWQNKLMDIVKKLVEDVGVNAIYLDQIASAAPRHCFDESHGHPVGSGSWWVDGYREILTKIKNYCTSQGRSVGLTSENNAEPYMDNIDSFLIWTPREQNEIPMITAVYSGYALYFASNRAFTYSFYDKISQGYGDESFCMLQARDFVWGTQLGWEDKLILAPEHAEKMKYQSKLARLRYKYRKYMSDGELLLVLKSINCLPKISGTWNTWAGDAPVTLCVAHGALWKRRDNKFIAVFANSDTEVIDYFFTFNYKDLCLSSPSTKIISTSDRRLLVSDNEGNYFDRVMIPARDGFVKEYEIL